MQPRAPARSTFRQSYDRGDFPISLKHDGRGNRISWKVRTGMVVVMVVVLTMWWCRCRWSLWTTTTTSLSSSTASERLSTHTSSLLSRSE